MIPPPPTKWPGLDGNAVGCREKMRVLAENHAELAQVMQDAFEDAVLMGVDEPWEASVPTGELDVTQPKLIRKARRLGRKFAA